VTAVGDLIASDIELAALKWAKANTAIAAVVHGQVHFEVPGTTPPFPLITLSLAGSGFPIASEALIERALISFSCWAKPFDKATSARVAAVLRTEAFNLYRAPVTVTVPGAAVTLHGADVDNGIWDPDPAGYARHVVDVVFTTTTRAAA